MADSVASQTIWQDGSFALMKFTNISDGTGESAVAKVDVSALSPACAQVRIRRIWYIMYGMAVRILWDATTDVVALLLPADGCGVLDFRDVRGSLTMLVQALLATFYSLLLVIPLAIPIQSYLNWKKSVKDNP